MRPKVQYRYCTERTAYGTVCCVEGRKEGMHTRKKGREEHRNKGRPEGRKEGRNRVLALEHRAKYRYTCCIIRYCPVRTVVQHTTGTRTADRSVLCNIYNIYKYVQCIIYIIQAQLHNGSGYHLILGAILEYNIQVTTATAV